MSHVSAALSLDPALSDISHQQAARARKRGLLGLAAAILVAAGGYDGYWYFIGSRYVSTDNAYSAVEVAEVTPAVGGDR